MSTPGEKPQLLIDTGGPAFPRAATIGSNGAPLSMDQDGMTWLDYCAIQTMQGLLASPESSLFSTTYGQKFEEDANFCYTIAQVMLRAKRKYEETGIRLAPVASFVSSVVRLMQNLDDADQWLHEETGEMYVDVAEVIMGLKTLMRDEFPWTDAVLDLATNPRSREET
jgi:hypothetical protein